MQVFRESRLSKCFSFESVLFEWKRSKYILKKKLQDYLNHSCWVFKWDKQATIITPEQTCLGSWGGQGAFSSHSCSDISILWAFSEMAARCLFGVVIAVPGWLWGGWKSGAWGWRYFEAISLGAGPGKFSDNEAQLIPRKGALAGEHTERSVGAHWKNPGPRFQGAGAPALCTQELKPEGAGCALSNGCVLSSPYNSTVGYWKWRSPARFIDAYQEPLENLGIICPV